MATHAEQTLAISNAKEKKVYGMLMGNQALVQEAKIDLHNACELIIDQTPEEKEHIRLLLIQLDPDIMQTLNLCSPEEYSQAIENQNISTND